MVNDKVIAPDFLYTFKPLENDVHLDRLKEILLDDKLWFSDPTKQNDPFEFRPIINTGKTFGEKRQFEKWVQGIYHKYGADRHQRTSSRKKLVKECRKDPQLLRKVYASYLEKHGMYCFTEDLTSILMWAYYGSGHTGYCLKFDTKKTTLFQKVKPINYSIEYPTVNPYAQKPDDLGKESVLTKAIYWEHECEWRLFSQKPGHLDFPPENLVGIVLGYNMCDSFRTQIKKWCNERDCPIQVLYAFPDGREYKINIKEPRNY